MLCLENGISRHSSPSAKPLILSDSAFFLSPGHLEDYTGIPFRGEHSTITSSLPFESPCQSLSSEKEEEA